jgi:hypothetical protein
MGQEYWPGADLEGASSMIDQEYGPDPRLGEAPLAMGSIIVEQML